MSTEFISKGQTCVISQNETIQPQLLDDIKKKRKSWEEVLCRNIKETETMLWTGELFESHTCSPALNILCYHVLLVHISLIHK